MSKYKIIFYRFLFFSALISIFIIAVLPSEKLSTTMKINDILNHSAAFITLSFLFSLSFKKTKSLYLFVSLAFYGILIETVQYFLPWRSCDLKDFLVDISAIIIFILINKLYKWRIKEFDRN
ncbi:MAG: VanZ family protein [Candidatus Muirbacterium halophilum]|nr:VanZ family protein [Candidatus Muirbacterium halophilum]MCK9475913.1 VanZ family protein [Candidatus Muirbacterium halophilum]